MTTLEHSGRTTTAARPARGLLHRPRATTGFWSWFTTVDHKKIGILYGATSLAFLVIFPVAAWSADDNVPLLDEDLLILGTIWRWKKLKGFEYAEDFADYERQVMDAMGRDGGKPTLSLTGSTYDIAPVVIVPSGSWNL